MLRGQAIVRDRAGGTAFVLGSTSESSNNLLEVEAKARAALISNVSYKLHLSKRTTWRLLVWNIHC